MATGLGGPTGRIYTVHQTGAPVPTQFRPISASLRASVTAFAVVVATGAGAQTQQGAAALDVKSAAHVRAEYLADLDTLHTKIVDLAKAIPADKYNWRPS